MMKMIDITTIQTFKIPEKLSVLMEKNNAVKIVNETLTEKNDTLQKLLIVSIIIIPILGIVIYQKKQLTKNQNKK